LNQPGTTASPPEIWSALSAPPFLEENTPQRAEDDDARHVERPTGKFVVAHLVEEKLEIPERPR
jgi:hypothetical protein